MWGSKRSRGPSATSTSRGGGRRFGVFFVILGLLFAFGGLFVTASSASATYGNTTKVVHAKSLDQACPEGQVTCGAHFVITQIGDDAPTSIEVMLSDDTTHTVDLQKISGGTAHYQLTFADGLTVTDATASVPKDWDGQFNLSHYLCKEGQTPPVTKVEVAQPTRDCDAISGSGSNTGDTNVYVVVTISENDSSDTAFMKEYTLKSGDNFSFTFGKAAGFDAAKEYVVNIATGPDSDNLTDFPVENLHLKPVDGCSTTPPPVTQNPSIKAVMQVCSAPDYTDGQVKVTATNNSTKEADLTLELEDVDGNAAAPVEFKGVKPGDSVSHVYTGLAAAVYTATVTSSEGTSASDTVKVKECTTTPSPTTPPTTPTTPPTTTPPVTTPPTTVPPTTTPPVKETCPADAPTWKDGLNGQKDGKVQQNECVGLIPPTKASSPSTTYPGIAPHTGGTGVSMFSRPATWAVIGGGLSATVGLLLMFGLGGLRVPSMQIRTRRH